MRVCVYQAGLNLPMWLKTQTKLFDNRNLISANAQPSVRMNGCVCDWVCDWMYVSMCAMCICHLCIVCVCTLKFR